MKKVEKNERKALSPDERVEQLLTTAKSELSDKAEREMVNKIKVKLEDLKAAKMIVQNLEREIDEMKIELKHELESIGDA